MAITGSASWSRTATTRRRSVGLPCGWIRPSGSIRAMRAAISSRCDGMEVSHQALPRFPEVAFDAVLLAVLLHPFLEGAEVLVRQAAARSIPAGSESRVDPSIKDVHGHVVKVLRREDPFRVRQHAK